MIVWPKLVWLRFRSSRYFLSIGLAMLAAAWTALVFAGGYYYSYQPFRGAELLFERISDRYGLPREGLDWRARFYALQSWIDVADRTHDQMKQQLYDKDQTIRELEEQLYLYRSVTAPEENAHGLSIFSVKLQRSADSRSYPIEVILRNHSVEESEVRGHIKVVVEGVSGSPGEKPVREDLLDGGRLPFSFRYFQRLRGLLQLPDDFVPHRLSIAVSGADRYKGFESTYDWEGLTGSE